jgi:transcriptional regulator with XRE-family HTH domain
MKEYMMSQKEFAEFFNIDYRKYNHYENSTSPAAETMLLIAKKLNRSVESIFYLDE